MRFLTRFLIVMLTRGIVSGALLGMAAHAQTTNLGITTIARDANGHYTLMRDGQPYVIQGAVEGGGGADKALFKANGGNSFRVRSMGTDTQKQLDEAQKLGMTMCLGYWIGNADMGFNWNNPTLVAKQKTDCLNAIKKYKDAPALLCWDIGNEMETAKGMAASPILWGAIEEIAKAGKDIDHNHPFMTTVAGVGDGKIAAIMKYCPDIDIIGINATDDISSIGTRYTQAGGTKPYVLTEFCPTQSVDANDTNFGAHDEYTSTEKSLLCKDAWEKNRENNLNLGGYASLWEPLPEMKDTTHSMVLSDNRTVLGCVDALCTAWTGKAPFNHCPIINTWNVEKEQGFIGDRIKITLDVSDPDGDPLTTKWFLKRGILTPALIGQPTSEDYSSNISEASLTGATVTLPQLLGVYSLYCYIYDGKGGAAEAFKPLNVTGIPPGTIIPAKVGQLPYTIYADGVTSDYTPSGRQQTQGVGLTLDQACTDNPHSGPTCMKISSSGPGQAQIIWQNPANNGGDVAGGLNLYGATELTFWARGAVGGESVDFGIGTVTKEHVYYDTALLKSPFSLTQRWMRYTIALTGNNLSRIVSGFTVGWNGPPRIFYLDDIVIEGINKEFPKIPTATLPFKVYGDGVTAPYTPGKSDNPQWMYINLDCTGNPHSGATCILLSSASETDICGDGWLPTDYNKYDIPIGYDITGATKLTFWARGDSGGETCNFGFGSNISGFGPGLASRDSSYGDKKITLSKDWTQYTIDLNGKDLSNIICGFKVSWSGPPRTIYLDDIQYEK